MSAAGKEANAAATVAAAIAAIVAARRARYDPSMRSYLPLLVAAFLTDASVYLVFAALPFRAIELGAGPLALGAIPAVYATAYMLSALGAGHLSDRVPRLKLARGACLLAALSALGLATVPALPLLYAILPAMGVALGFFWSPLQAALSDLAPEGQLLRAIGVFNMTWTLGKGSGLVVGGFLTQAFSPHAVLLLGGAPVALAALALPWRTRPHVAAATPSPSAEEAVPTWLLRLAWMTNALAYGLVGTMNMHAPKLLLAQGLGPATFGLLLGSVYGVQALVFLVMRRRAVSPGLLSVALASGALAVVVFLRAPGELRLLCAIPFGVATGVAYHSSLHASLHRPHGRGLAAGLHEMLIGAGNASVPLAGGALARASGSLAAPFLLAGTLLGAGFVTTLVRRRSSPVAAVRDAI